MKHEKKITTIILIIAVGSYWIGHKTGYDTMQMNCQDIVTSKLKPAAPVFYITRSK